MAGTRRVVWAPAAKRDLLKVWRYYSKVASPEIADQLAGEIRFASDRLGTQPLLGRSRNEVAPGLRSVLAHPYAIFYRIKDDSIEIVRVIHERRDFTAVFSTRKP